VYIGSGAANALYPGSECVQASNQGPEDCLFLNIWISGLPLRGGISTKLKPVMLFTHGGTFTGGAGSQSIFGGGITASRGDVVAVNINYRLGNAVTESKIAQSPNGNHGLVDQLTAIDRIPQNIRKFGGDPNKSQFSGKALGRAPFALFSRHQRARGDFSAAIMK